MVQFYGQNYMQHCSDPHCETQKWIFIEVEHVKLNTEQRKKPLRRLILAEIRDIRFDTAGYIAEN